MALAWVYTRLGALPQVGWLLYGVKPVVVAIILQALGSLGRKTIREASTAVVAASVLLLYFLGVNEIALLFGGALALMVARNLGRLRGRMAGILLLPLGGAAAGLLRALLV